MQTYIGARSEEEQPHTDQADIEDCSEPAAKAPLLVELGPIISAAHAEISHAPENETEKGIK